MVLDYIDDSHVPIIALSHKEELYVNRKGVHSINIEAICGNDLKFIDVVAKWPSSSHDAFIWRQSGINLKIVLGEIPTNKGWFLGECGYPLRPNLLTPIISPATSEESR